MIAAKNLRGDFAEIGVYRGHTCEPLCRWAHAAGKTCYAVDSFTGMAEPGPRDAGLYAAGTYDLGGQAGVDALRARCGDAVRSLVVVAAYIPEAFDFIPADVRFSFVHVDLDHYQPQLDALRFAWERLAPGGVIASHDWFPDRTTLAAGAFNDFCVEIGVPPAGSNSTRHGLLKKERD